MGHKVSQTYQSGDWLKSDDLKRPDGSYGRVEAVIAKVDLTQVKKDRNSDQMIDRLEVHFVGKDKCLLLNKTNAGNIAMMYGDDTDNWTGKTIGITVHQTQMGPGLLVMPGYTGSQAAPQSAAQGFSQNAGYSHGEPILPGDDLDSDIPF